MPGTVTGYPPGKNLASFSNVATKLTKVFIIHILYFIGAKTAYPLASAPPVAFHYPFPSLI
jgi:hypothetical protein